MLTCLVLPFIIAFLASCNATDFLIHSIVKDLQSVYIDLLLLTSYKAALAVAGVIRLVPMVTGGF